MIRVVAMYPNRPGTHFDFDYYAQSHMGMVKERMSEFGLRGISIVKGTSALDGGSAPYICIGTVDFDSLEEMQRGLDIHAEDLLADVPNYTDIAPEIQISEVLSND